MKETGICFNQETVAIRRNYRFRLKKYAAFCSIIASLCAAEDNATAAHMHMELDEIAQASDLIFEGTASEVKYVKEYELIQASGESIITTNTEIQFENISIISSNSLSRQAKSNTIQFEYSGGGEFADYSLCCGQPRLEGGRRYVVFAFDDGQSYLNPLVGGNQGLYEILFDDVTTKTYVMNNNRKLLYDIANKDGRPEFVFTLQRVHSISNGVPKFESIEPGEDPFGTTGTLEKPDGTVQIIPARMDPADLKPIPSELFYKTVLNALNNSKSKTVMQMTMERERSQSKFRNLSEKATTVTPILNSMRTPRGQVLYAGKSRSIPFAMYQRHTSEWEYNADADLMHVFDKYLNVSGKVVFDRKSFTGAFPTWDNGKSEFGGFQDDAGLIRYDSRKAGVGWGSAVGICYTDNASVITQSDIMVKKQGAGEPSWTPDYMTYLNNGGSYLYFNQTCLHELGHAMGLQTGGAAEQYNYDRLSIMHSSYYYMTNRAKSLFPMDCKNLRSKNPNWDFGVYYDFGIESMYAQNGLKLSSTNSSVYNAGDPIRLYNMTATNSGHSPAGESCTLNYYLSTSRTGKTYPLGGNIKLTFKEQYGEMVFSMDDGDLIIPTNVPTGDYYIVMTVTDGCPNHDCDAVSFNNMTSFYSKIRVNGVPRPDLQDGGEPRSFSPSKSSPNGSVNVNGKIKNSGNATAGSCRVNFYASTDTTINTSDFSIGNIEIPGLVAGPALEFNFNGILPSNITPGNYYVGWIIDSANSVTESNEGNNVVCISTAKLEVVNLTPDLQDGGEPSSFSPSQSGPNGTLNIMGRIKNGGTAVSNSCKTSFYVSADTTINNSDYLIGNMDLPSLSAGSLVEFNFDGTLPSDITPGNYYVGWIIDSTNSVTELNEDNNVVCITTPQLEINNLADLAFDFADATMTVKGKKGIITGSLRVKNRGHVKTPATYLMMTIHNSDGSFIDVLKEYAVPGLEPGESVDIQPGVEVRYKGKKQIPKTKVIKFKFPKDYAYGKILGFFLDVEESIPESNEDNNSYASYIQAPPPKTKK